MLKLETKADLEALHTGNVKESLQLEYKSSPAVDKKDNNKKVEMARDVSAFANADGGQIVYGMTEEDHEPAGLDQGIDPRVYPEIWFEQVLQQHITPNLSGLRIHHVPLQNGNVAVVITIPAGTGDPHQTSDNRYYRRHNFNRLAMEHYEVRDSFRRTTNPDLRVDFHFAHMRRWEDIDFGPDDEESRPIGITASLTNVSNQPAMYTVVCIFLDVRLPIYKVGPYEQAGASINRDNIKQQVLRLKMSADKFFPIFKEAPIMIPAFAFRVPVRALSLQQKFAIAYEIRAPGCFKYETGYLENVGAKLVLHMPSHTLPSDSAQSYEENQKPLL